jgi:uncharacterized protein (DUF1810 family)
MGHRPALTDPFDLARFVAAQVHVYPQVRAELRAGRKTSHWMWFIFPQIAGLGHSATAVYYALASADAARAYLAHPLLGPRLRDCVAAVLDFAGTPAEAIFGDVDARKLHSSLTLFAAVSDAPCFADGLRIFFGGVPDAATLARL